MHRGVLLLAVALAAVALYLAMNPVPVQAAQPCPPVSTIDVSDCGSDQTVLNAIQSQVNGAATQVAALVATVSSVTQALQQIPASVTSVQGIVSTSEQAIFGAETAQAAEVASSISLVEARVQGVGTVGPWTLSGSLQVNGAVAVQTDLLVNGPVASRNEVYLGPTGGVSAMMDELANTWDSISVPTQQSLVGLSGGSMIGPHAQTVLRVDGWENALAGIDLVSYWDGARGNAPGCYWSGLSTGPQHTC